MSLIKKTDVLKGKWIKYRAPCLYLEETQRQDGKEIGTKPKVCVSQLDSLALPRLVKYQILAPCLIVLKSIGYSTRYPDVTLSSSPSQKVGFSGNTSP
jgi:hypothetical protein